MRCALADCKRKGSRAQPIPGHSGTWPCSPFSQSKPAPSSSSSDQVKLTTLILTGLAGAGMDTAQGLPGEAAAEGRKAEPCRASAGCREEKSRSFAAHLVDNNADDRGERKKEDVCMRSKE